MQKFQSFIKKLSKYFFLKFLLLEFHQTFVLETSFTVFLFNPLTPDRSIKGTILFHKTHIFHKRNTIIPLSTPVGEKWNTKISAPGRNLLMPITNLDSMYFSDSKKYAEFLKKENGCQWVKQNQFFLKAPVGEKKEQKILGSLKESASIWKFDNLLVV